MLRIIVTENYIFYVCGGLEDSVVLVFLLLEFVVFMLLQVVFVVQLPKGAHARASACVLTTGLGYVCRQFKRLHHRLQCLYR